MKFRWKCCFFLIGILVTLYTSAEALTPEQRALHVLNRLGYGPRPGDVERVAHMGIGRYIDEQLHPQTIPMPEELLQHLKQLPYANASSSELLGEFIEKREELKASGGSEEAKKAHHQWVKSVDEQMMGARLLSAVYSPRQLEEVMVDFWFNHFNVFIGKGMDHVLVGSYEREAIRPYVFGKFRDLLEATAKHPAMLFYLDNWLSVSADFHPLAKKGKQDSTGLNENYARELMELHTLGVDGGYTQHDVTELARMLTGWTFNPKAGAVFRFVGRRHDWGDKEWLNRHIPASGESEGEMALDILASSPATAQHISYQLAQYFVSDTPSPALVTRMQQEFLRSQGDIRSVLSVLFKSHEFWAQANIGTKFKTPYQYVVSGIRAADIPFRNVRPVIGVLAQLGMPLYGCQTPDGYKNTEQAWMNPDALTRRINVATALGMGRLKLSRSEENGNEDGRDARDFAVSSPIPVDPSRLMTTLWPGLSQQTQTVVAKTQLKMQASLILGSPDFMRH